MTHDKIGYRIAVYGSFVIVLILFLVWFYNGNRSIELGGMDGLDDQRSTLWPILISLVATLLGSLITTYVFLKESLDRMVDDRPYYNVVIQSYRNQIMRYLWYYALATLGLMTVVVFLYYMLYYWEVRSGYWIRLAVVTSYLIAMVLTAAFLYRCINTNWGLNRTAKLMLGEKQLCVEKYTKELADRKMIERLERSIGKDNWIVWLQIAEGSRDNCISKKQFINRFSKWERLLLLLIRTDEGFHSKQSVGQRIHIALQDGEEAFYANEENDIEHLDAYAHGWHNRTYDKIKRLQNILELRGTEFADIYILLSDYRDFLQVHMETSNKKEYNNLIEGNQADVLSKLFLVFLLYLSTKIFYILPKIEVFAPAAKFEFANFYNVRFEDSSFRGSLFKNAVFARSKINNNNFGMASFKRCEFFSADSRNCSLSNTLFAQCGFQESIFDNVDFTGAFIKGGQLAQATFQDSILVNLELDGVKISQVSFNNCKLWNITLKNTVGMALEGCCFADCDLYNIMCIFDSRQDGLARNKRRGGDDYLALLLDRDLEKHYWGENDLDKGNAFKKVKKMVERHKILDEQFYIQKEQVEKGKKQGICPHPAWRQLENIDKVNMRESVFNNAMMPEFAFYRVNLEQSMFRNAQMKGVQLIGVYMPGCIMDGANMREALMFAVHMRSAVLDDAVFFKATCKLVNIEDASLKALHASETDISFGSLSRSDCTSIDLTKAKVFNSTFRDSILNHAELTDAVFEKVGFENSIADEMLSSYSVFKNCRFINANLSQSCFNYTVFHNCDFSLANFSDSAVTNAEFHNCNFYQSNFNRSCFINACFRDNESMNAEIFEGSKFISCQFKGTNQEFEEDVESSGGIVVV